jgi:hypothetical protein
VFKRIDAGAWLPDLAQHNHDGLKVARNVIPIANGYGPVGSLQAFTATLADFRGAGSFIGSDGTSALIAGTGTKLVKWSGSAWLDVVTGLTAGRWEFEQFGDFAIGVHGGTPVKYNVVSGVGASLGGSPPDARFIAIGGNFVVLAGDPAAVSTVTWSGFNAAETWTAGTNQSDSQEIPDGGKITGLAGHENYFLVFQRDSINRFTYIGQPGIFQRDKISTGVGCIASGSIAQTGEITFFLSERGFMQTDGNTVSNRNDSDMITACVDPQRYLYIVAAPGRLWIYNWALKRWADIVTTVKEVFTGFTSSITLEGLDALYPGGLDAIPISLDSPILLGGVPRLFGVSNDFVVSTFSGPSLEARIEWPLLEFVNGRTRIHRGMPQTDATALTVTIDARLRLGDPSGVVSHSELRENGTVPLRANGRYIAPGVTVPAGAVWTYFQGLDIEYGTGGAR